MANILLNCFLPSSASSINSLANELVSSLAIDLQKLQKSLESNPITLKWCSEAMLVVEKTHAHFLEFFVRARDSDPWEGLTMVDEYMNVSIDLLDFCNLMKSAVTSLDRHRMMVDFMVKSVKDTPASFEKIEFRKWDNFSKAKMKSKIKMHVLEPITCTMSIICLFIFCSILYPIPVKIHQGLFYRGFQNQDLFLKSVRKLGITFGEKVKRVEGKGRSILYENEMIQDALAAFTAEFGGGKGGEDGGEVAERVKNSCVALKEGIDLFESVVNELFDDVIKGRKKVMELINVKNHCLYNYSVQ